MKSELDGLSGDRESGPRIDCIDGVVYEAGSVEVEAVLQLKVEQAKAHGCPYSGSVCTQVASEPNRCSDDPSYNPAEWTAMRGSGYPEAYRVGHQVRDTGFWKEDPEAIDTNEDYDLIVVGAGISGLSATYFYRQAEMAGKRILILDNHDDFGGHAKRNEFIHNGDRTLAPFGFMASMVSLR